MLLRPELTTWHMKPMVHKINEWKEDFLSTHLLRRHSENTIRTYEHCLDKYINFCHNLDTDIFSKDSVRKFLQWENKQNYSPQSIALDITVLRTFFDYLIDNDINIKNVWKNQYIKKDNRLVSYLHNDEVEYLLKNCKLKLLPYIKLMLYAGLRVSEVCNVKKSDIYEQDGLVFIKVLGKGNKERVSVIVADIDEARSFIGFEASPKITPNVIKSYLWRLAMKSGYHITAHKLRHTFATRLLNRGLDITAIGSLLGHNDIRTTMKYAEVTQSKIKDNLLKLQEA